MSLVDQFLETRIFYAYYQKVFTVGEGHCSGALLPRKYDYPITVFHIFLVHLFEYSWQASILGAGGQGGCRHPNENITGQTYRFASLMISAF